MTALSPLDALLARLRAAGPLTSGAPWRALLRRFDQHQQRERLLMVVALAALCLSLADALWLTPALAAYKAAKAQQASADQALLRLQADAHQLQDQGSALARDQQTELATWRQRVREGEAALHSQQDLLVGPDRMIELLEHLLARHGELQVRALRSLGRSDLLAAPGTAVPATTSTTSPANAANAAPAGADPATPTLYRHGVELVLEGSYADLLSYLKAMEALPQRVLWGSVRLKVEQHPRSVLTLRVYTLSRDRHWLEI